MDCFVPLKREDDDDVPPSVTPRCGGLPPSASADVRSADDVAAFEGMFLPDAWYDACDELGIMVYHDMQYAQHGHSPTANDDQEAELRHIIRRLSAHTSIVVYDGCNECTVIIGTPTGIYATFVMTVVAEEDKSRSIWPSCPALGWTKGVDMLTSRPLPNTNTSEKTYAPQLLHPLNTPNKGPRIETHGPYQHGTSRHEYI